jgi:uncharacterized protein (DUF2132 family)
MERPGQMVGKRVDEVYPTIAKRFPEAIDDLVGFSTCYLSCAYTAAVFHLMRVVERGLSEIASLAAMKDNKPSWGSVLRHLEKTAYKTEYNDLPDAVKPHVALIKDAIPKMQAIEHAWRNRIMHIENKLYPMEPIDKPVASDIMNAVEGFMRILAERLPAREQANAQKQGI